MGSPEYLDESQVAMLKANSELVTEFVTPVFQTNSIEITVTIPPQGVVALTFASQ